MKPRYVVLAALAATTLFALAGGSIGKLPEPWLLAGQTPEHYDIGLDSAETVSGKGGKFIRNVDGVDKGWGTLMQSIAAKNYLGQRLRLQAKIKTRDVGSAGLWMRVDKPEKMAVAFYNSQDKPIVGSSDWQIRSVVLDVPADSSLIAFGVLQHGKGQVWLDELSLEVVGKEVPVDAIQPSAAALSERPSL
jgi:hypothetical protein